MGVNCIADMENVSSNKNLFKQYSDVNVLNIYAEQLICCGETKAFLHCLCIHTCSNVFFNLSTLLVDVDTASFVSQRMVPLFKCSKTSLE